MISIIRVLFLFGCIFLFQDDSFTQNNKTQNEKYVIVLDVQEEFTITMDTASCTEMIQSINSIIEHSNPCNIIYIQQIHKVLSLSFKAFTVDTLPVSKLDSRLQIVNSNFFGKGESNAFANDSLVDFLNSQQAKDIIVVGLMAESCIYKTAIGAKKQGFNVYVVPEAIVGKTEDGKNKAMAKLTNKKVKTISLKEFIPK